MLSDVLFPYLAGRLLGVDMELHICFHRELQNVIPLFGCRHIEWPGLAIAPFFYAASIFLGVSFIHILISSLAALFYMVSHGFTNWYDSMGILFLFLVIAIVIPCTFSDVVVPMYWAGRNNEKH